MHRGRRREQPPAVIYIDLDGFKAVNDDGGHQLGDQVLRAVARRLAEAVRPADVAARVGGDEFAVVCEDLSSSADAEHLAVRIRDAVDNRVFQTSLELHAAAMEDGHTCALFDGVVGNLDRLIVDVRLEMFAAYPDSERQAADPATEIARAMETLDAALHHLDGAWTAVVTSGDDHALGDRLSHAAHLAKSATRVLSSEVLY